MKKTPAIMFDIFIVSFVPMANPTPTETPIPTVTIKTVPSKQHLRQLRPAPVKPVIELR